MFLINKVWFFLDSPLQLWGYSLSAILMLFIAFTTTNSTFPVLFRILKLVVVLFSLLLVSKIVSKLRKKYSP